MNKIMLKIFIIIGITFNVSYINAVDYKVYFGGLMTPVTVSGFEDAYAVDGSWHSGFLGNKVILNLAEGNRDGLSGGMILGFKTTSLKVNPLLEIQFLPGTSIIGNVLIGPEIKLKSTGKLNLALIPKIGYGFYYHELGELKTTVGDPLSKYVELNDGTRLNPGDKLETQSTGFVSQTVFAATYNLIENFISINLEVGYSFSKYSTPEVKISRKEFLATDEEEVGSINIGDLSDEDGNSKSINPEISTTGLVTALSITIQY